MLYVLCGIPGSGKTTLSRKIADKYDAVIYSYDNLPNANHTLHHHTVRREMWANVANDLRNGLNVVIDDVNILREQRLEMLSTITDIDCKKTIIVMQTPYDVCIERNRNRLRRLHDGILYALNKRYEQPTLAEGWDTIIYHNNGGEKLCIQRQNTRKGGENR